MSDTTIEFPAGFFPILPWDTQHGRDGKTQRVHGLESIAACNFTMSGFVRPEDLVLCERLGLSAIMYPDVSSGVITRNEWTTLTGDEIDRRIKTMVDKLGTSDAILGYYLIDEPGAALFPAPPIFITIIEVPIMTKWRTQNES